MRAWRVTVAADDEDLAIAALWDAGTAGVEGQAAPGGPALAPAHLAADAQPADTALPPPADG